jgi:hypothetical protein
MWRPSRDDQMAIMTKAIVRRLASPSANSATAIPPSPTAKDQIVSIQPLDPVTRWIAHAPVMISASPAAVIANNP